MWDLYWTAVLWDKVLLALLVAAILFSAWWMKRSK